MFNKVISTPKSNKILLAKEYDALIRHAENYSEYLTSGIEKINNYLFSLDNLENNLIEDTEFLKLAYEIPQDLVYGFLKFVNIRNICKYWVTHYGSARVKKDDKKYIHGKELGAYLALNGDLGGITGGGPGFMLAPIEGIVAAGLKAFFGFNINIHINEKPNYIFAKNPGHCTMSNHFAARKILLTYWSKGFVIHMGGYGTNDETYEIKTLIQTLKMSPYPIIFYDIKNGNFWRTYKGFVSHLEKNGLINKEDKDIIQIMHEPSEVLNYLEDFNYYNFVRFLRINGGFYLVFKNSIHKGILDDIAHKSDLSLHQEMPPEESIYKKLGYAHYKLTAEKFSWWKIQQAILHINRRTKAQEKALTRMLFQ
ncbi:MAG: LOG family protein [Candidatus Margulisbacteria bacterium]|nr:LOG family protein [Candidatus Margulisiibacteriota bacterium]